MRPVQPAGARLIYRPGQVESWIKGKTVAVIGDGPSKRKYIFAPDQVITFAINKAAIFYPSAMAAVVECHFDEIMVQLPPWVPVLFFGSTDIRRYNIGPSLWTVVVLLSFLAAHAKTIYVQGVDMSQPKYREQIPLLSSMAQENRYGEAEKIICVDNGPLSKIFNSDIPKIEHIC